MKFWNVVFAFLFCSLPFTTFSAYSQEIKGKRVELDIQAEKYWSSFIGCLKPALKSAGTELSMDYLSGYIGSAFTFSMNEDGEKLAQADNYEWSYFWPMIRPLNKRQISASKKKNDPNWKEKHTAAKKEAWDQVRSDIDQGYPSVVWQPMTAETKASGKRPIPFLWGLIIGYDENKETYIVHHSVCGKLSIRWDGFGHSDGANWFCVMTFRPTDEPIDMTRANRRAISRAIESSHGKRPGVRASAHGIAAWEMWLNAFNKNTVLTEHVNQHATFLIKSRSAAGAYLRQIHSQFPSGSDNLSKAAQAYDKVVSDMKILQDLFSQENPNVSNGAQVLKRALEAEKAALSHLEMALKN